MVYTKKERGISLLTLIITVVVIIILSVMVMTVNNTVLDSGTEAKFKQEITDIKKGVETIKLINSKEGIDEKTLNAGFIKVKVSGDKIPDSFVSFDIGEKTAYLVDLEKIDYKKLKTGHRYKEIEENDTVFFGIDDAYIYDKEGTVYYLKGIYIDGDELTYTSEEKKTYGPKVSAENIEKGKIKIEVTPTKDGEITNVTVDGKVASKVNEINGTYIYEYEVTKNGTYTILATEKDNGTTKANVKVTKLEDQTDKKTDATYGNIKINNSDEEEQYTVNKNATLNIETDADLIYIKHITTGSTPTAPTSITPGWENAVESKRLYLSEGKNEIYVWFRNNGSNVILNDSKSIVLESIPESSSLPVPSIECVPKNDYTEKVTVTITYPDSTKDSKYEKWYRQSDGEWKVATDLEVKLEIDENIKIDAVVVRKISGQTILGKIVSVTINNIDNNAPEIGEIILEPSEENDGINITGTIKIKDNETKVVEYAVTKNELIPTNWENILNPEKEVTIKVNLEQGNTYYIWAKDECGNINKKEVIAQIEYEVTFDANGGLIGEFETVKRKVTYGKTYGEIVEGMPVATKYGHTFLGWSIQKNNSGDKVTSETIVTGAANNQTLYAIWSEEAIAIYSADDNSLRFYKTAITPKEGEIYKDKIVTNIYFGVERDIYSTYKNVPWYKVRNNIQIVKIEDTISPIATSNWFNGCEKLSEFIGEENLNTTNVTTMSRMFQVCTSIVELDLSSWNVGNVTDMRYMFLSADGFEAMKLKTIGDVSNWDTKNVESMQAMFQKCSNLESLNVSNWNINNVTDLSYMFNGCSKLKNINVNSWKTENVTNMKQMFNRCSNLENINVSSWKTENVTNMKQIFNRCSNLESVDVSNWNISNVTDLSYMFNMCSKLKNIDISAWKTPNLIDMTSLFYNCQSLTKVDLSNFDTSNIKSESGDNVFYGCNNLQEVTLGANFNFVGENGYLPAPSDEYIPGADGNWYNKETGAGYAPEDVPTGTLATYVAVNPESAAVKGILIDTSSNIADLEYKLILCTPTEEELEEISSNGTYKGEAVEEIYGSSQIGGADRWGRLELTSTEWEARVGAIKEVIIEDKIILNSNSYSVFQSFTGLEEIKNIENLDTSKVTDMTSMFSNCASLTSLDLTSFNIGNVKYMNFMFYDCINLTSINLSNWNTTNVTTMVEMFYYCYNLTSLDLSSFDTTNAITTMMFDRCTNLQEVTLGANFKWKGTDGYLPVPSDEYIEGADGKWYDTNTGIGYVPSEIPERTEITTYVATAPQAVAIYSVDDASLKFYKTAKVPSVGGRYNGKLVTAVYTGFETATYESEAEVPWYNMRNDISSVMFVNEIVPESTAYWFAELVVVNNIDVTNLNTSNVKYMTAMFYYAGQQITEAFKIVGLNNKNTVNVQDMSNMFFRTGQKATTWNIGDLSVWNTSQVTNMFGMFEAAGNAATTWNIGDLSDWDTSQVTNMSEMFWFAGENATTWNIGDLDNWNTSQVTDMSNMFLRAGNAATTWNIGDLSGWDTSQVTDMAYMFFLAGSSATTWNIGDLDNWNTSQVIDMAYMFSSAGYSATTWNIGNLDSWDTSQVTNMFGMFGNSGYSATTWNIGDLSAWNTSQVTNMSNMFINAGYNSSTPITFNLSNWNMTNINNISFMFYGCRKLQKLDISGWNTLNVTTASDIFYDCTGLECVTLGGKNFKWVGTNGYLPAPSGDYIEGATGYWYNSNGEQFAPEEIPSNTADTYTAIPTTYKVRFEANGGNIYDLGDTWTERDVVAGSTYGAAGNFPEAVRDGYEFLGWFTSGDEEKQITSETKVDKTAEGLVVYAKWEEGEAFAIYSSTDRSLTFYKAKTVPKEGSTYNDKSVTYLFTGFEDATYNSEDEVPWHGLSYIYSVAFENKISPKSTAYWFYGITNAGSIDVTKLDTSKVEDMRYMFAYTGKEPNKTDSEGWIEDTFSIIGLENFDTSKVTNMQGMFQGAARYYGNEDELAYSHAVSNVDIGDISRWNTSNVRNMSYMFSAFAFEVKEWNVLGDLSKKTVKKLDGTTYTAWDTKNVTDMSHMFSATGYWSDSFELQGLGTWDVSSVETMENMFYEVGHEAETWSIGDLGNWNPLNVTSMLETFWRSRIFCKRMEHRRFK